jgi:glycosyltransferase involved in cell wall biosynthesis
MYDEWFPEEKARRAWHIRIEREVVEYASKVVLTTDGTREMYMDRYKEEDPMKFECIPNGYDRKILDEIERSIPEKQDTGERLRILHSGILYTLERDPTELFEAVANLKKNNKISADDVELVFRGSRYDDHYQPLLNRLGIDDIITFRPGVGYREAITEMFEVDGLLLMQGSVCNQQIPAKVYEYMRVGKPLLALTDRSGDTARLLESVEYGSIAAIDKVSEIEDALVEFVAQIRRREARLPAAGVVSQFARESASLKLAAILDSVAT